MPQQLLITPVAGSIITIAVAIVTIIVGYVLLKVLTRKK